MAVLWRIIAIRIWFLSTGASNVGGGADTALANKMCNGVKFRLGGTYTLERDKVLDHLMPATPNQGYNYYSQSVDSGQGCKGYYGHAACKESSRMPITLKPNLN
ncbi:hypothetical protein NL676_037528 [Syzygium grande]|nr:hypothetical protein NL676_037528 [Syzygium grande]